MKTIDIGLGITGFEQNALMYVAPNIRRQVQLPNNNVESISGAENFIIDRSINKKVVDNIAIYTKYHSEISFCNFKIENDDFISVKKIIIDSEGLLRYILK